MQYRKEAREVGHTLVSGRNQARHRSAISSGSMSLCLLAILVTLLSPLWSQAAAFSVRTFSPWSGYAIPNGLWLTGDINGDKKMDVIHAVESSDYIHTWLSNGDGTFNVGTFRPWAGYAIPNGQWLTGDVNGDGKTDIIHAVQGADYVHTWISNGDGTFNVGTFRPWIGYAIPNGIWLSADINSDGKTDIVHAVQGTDYVHTWTSNGDGTFAMGTFRPWSGYAIPNGIWLAADINADGKTDIVHAVQGADYVHTWISNGDGTFAMGTFRPWSGYGIPNGVWLTGDINADGKIDLIHAVENSDYVHTWLSNGDGTFNVGTFRPWAGYAIPNGVWLVADVNRDQRADIVHVVQNSDYAHIWLSRGDGSFTIRTFSPWAGYAIPNGLWLAGDLSGDGKADLLHAVANSDYAHPWISTMPGPDEVALDGVEITQAIQDMAHTVPLVAGKSTIARAYLSTESANPVTVRGTLALTRGTRTYRINSLNAVTVDPTQNWQLAPKRADVNQSLNFRIPARRAGAGNVRVRLSRVVDAGGAPIGCSDCATNRVAVNLHASAPLRLRVIALRYTTGTPPVSFAPSGTDFNLTDSWLKRAYPVGSVLSTTVTTDATAAWPFGCGDANAQVAAMRANDIAGGTDKRTHYYGLVADGGGFMRGCAAAIPGTPDPTAVASGPTGSGTFGWDNDGSYGDWYTGHELGHTYGRFHPGSGCGESSDDASFPYPSGQLADASERFAGFDVGDASNGIAMAALQGTVWHDVMTYCPNQWLSAYTYTGIHSRLSGEDVLPAGPVPVGANRTSGASASVIQAGDPGKVVARKSPAAVVPGRSHLVLTRPAARDGSDARLVAAAEAQVPAPVTGREIAPSAAEAAQTTPPRVERESQKIAVPANRGKRDSALKVKRGDLLSVVATINLTKATGTIKFVNRVQRGFDLPMAPGSEIEIVLLNSAGRMLKKYPVALKRDTDIPANEDQTGLVDTVVPFVNGSAEVRVLLFGDIVDSRKVSASAGGARALRGTGIVDVKAGPGKAQEYSWQAMGGEGTTYTLQLSSDNGKTWQTVAIGLTEPRYSLDPNDVGTTATMLRVLANDGINNTVVGTRRSNLR